MEEFSENDLYGSSTLQKPCFKKKLRSRKQKTLGSVHFECVIVPVGDPSMKIQWLLEGKPLECANRIKEKFEFGHASLDISTVYPRDTGKVKWSKVKVCLFISMIIIINSLKNYSKQN